MTKFSLSGFIQKKYFALTCLFAIFGVAGTWGLSPSRNDRTSSTILSTTAVDFSPIRGEFNLLRLRRSGFVYRCSECHRIFQTPAGRRKLFAEHTNIILDHGRNDYCLNCHHKTNRDVYIAHDGSEIPSDRPAELCAKCHGPTYRDWLAGAHGRIGVTWVRNNNPAARLLCIQCHDPHAPKFPKLPPMPKPARGRVDLSGGGM